MNKPHPEDCVCALCRNDKDFIFPEHLLDKIADGEVVLFAGAGISTESRTHCQSTLYEEIQAELKSAANLSFPELMDAFCAQPDGRIKLLEKIKHRFDYFLSFDDFIRPMTRFHRSLSPLYMIKDVITTNWDDFFERECRFDAFVYDSDLAFWDAAKRRVMKIHGSITNFGSIVATTNDYNQSFERLNDGPLGAQLKSLIARKTIIYVGYSLSDENYLRLLRNLARLMQGNLRQSYFISPKIDLEKLAKAPVPLIPIDTDGAFFFEKAREQLSERCEITRDEAFAHCANLLEDVAEAHNKTADAFIRTQHPLLIFVLSYQDGLIHALQRILRMRRTGEYHSKTAVHVRVHTYEHRIQELSKGRDHWNAAYALGYQSGLLFLLLKSDDDDGPSPPLIGVPFDVAVKSLSGVLRYPKDKLPRSVKAQASKILKRHPKDARLIPDHTPYL
jgi:NAD-dependent SIR2 family protein deacetylase